MTLEQHYFGFDSYLTSMYASVPGRGTISMVVVWSDNHMDSLWERRDPPDALELLQGELAHRHPLGLR